MLAIYLLFNFTIEMVLANVIIFVTFILCARYFSKKREKEFHDNKKVKAKIDRNEVVDVLIDSLRQPTLLLSRKHEVLSYNQSFSELIKTDINEYVNSSDYIQQFIRGGHKHRRFERKINNRTFYIDLDIIDSDKIKGTIITYTDVSNIKNLYAQQENFISEVKHELKTPVTAVVGLSELLINDKVVNSEDQKKILKTIKNETKRLDKLITKLTTSIETITTFDYVDLNDVFEELKLIYEEKSLEIPLTFSNYVEDSFLSDKEIIKQIIINLVNNSLKFTKSGYIKVSAIQENDMINVSVVDTGEGISQEEIEHVFERFYRVDKDNQEGFGLGLSIVKSLLNKINATIKVESILKKGSTFSILIPYKKSTLDEEVK
ncbi:signal transduction histidine kinase [Bacilli bacterium PM5-3]|nr:signal transduction histidine kinase [Bacilli bacterium PM5-3]MDH6603467.1 signal transduction histidine kinase [Bacilli bacterium PM5-9]